MALLTLGSAAGVLGFLWKFRFAAIGFYKFKTIPFVEPKVGQIWSYASLRNTNDKGKMIKWRVVEITTTDIIFSSNQIADQEDIFNVKLDEWEDFAKKGRYFVLKDMTNIEDIYWGSASDE